MSIFDPYSLYRRTYRKTHKGQIIQQKPTDIQTPILKSEIPRSLAVLKTFNYSIFPPNISFYPQQLTIPTSLLYSQPYVTPSGSTIPYITYHDLILKLRAEYLTYLPTIGITADNYTNLIESVKLEVDINDVKVFAQTGSNETIDYILFSNIPNGWTFNIGSVFASNPQEINCFFVPETDSLKCYCYGRQTTDEIIGYIDTLEDYASTITFSLEGLEVLEYIFTANEPPVSNIFTGLVVHTDVNAGYSQLNATFHFNLTLMPKTPDI